ncbi:MAG TPA: hypothetical protein VF432_07910 [Thermoanaerobaculia bacterium]
MDTADRILDALLAGVHYAVRRLVMQRFAAMERELGFRWEQTDGDAVFLRRLGYSYEHLRVLCALNSFYQVVIGPLSAASRKWRTTDFDMLTIRHGQLALGPLEAAQLREMVTRFERIFGEIEMPFRFGAANTTGDLIFVLASFERLRQEEE